MTLPPVVFEPVSGYDLEESCRLRLEQRVAEFLAVPHFGLREALLHDRDSKGEVHAFIEYDQVRGLPTSQPVYRRPLSGAMIAERQ